MDIDEEVTFGEAEDDEVIFQEDNEEMDEDTRKICTLDSQYNAFLTKGTTAHFKEFLEAISNDNENLEYLKKRTDELMACPTVDLPQECALQLMLSLQLWSFKVKKYPRGEFEPRGEKRIQELLAFLIPIKSSFFLDKRQFDEWFLTTIFPFYQKKAPFALYRILKEYNMKVAPEFKAFVVDMSGFAEWKYEQEQEADQEEQETLGPKHPTDVRKNKSVFKTTPAPNKPKKETQTPKKVEPNPSSLTTKPAVTMSAQKKRAITRGPYSNLDISKLAGILESTPKKRKRDDDENPEEEQPQTQQRNNDLRTMQVDTQPPVQTTGRKTNDRTIRL